MGDHDGQKFCPWCQTWKDEECFHLNGRGRTRRRTCSECTQARRRKNNQDKRGRRDALTIALLELARYDLDRLLDIEQDEFIKKTQSAEAIKEFDYQNIVEEAKLHLYKSGHHRPKNISLPPGKYLVVGDSHGKHTRTKMFNLLKNVVDYVGVDNIIHIGHMLDDDNDISFHWKKFDNLIVVSKQEEAKTLEKIIEEDGYDFQIVREEIEIGDLKVLNQDLIQDYVKTFVGSLDQEIFPDTVTKF